MSDIDTQIEEILDVLIMGYCPELIGDINKSFQYYTKAHKAIKTLLIQSKIDELDSNRNLIGYEKGSITLTDDDVNDRIGDLQQEIAKLKEELIYG